MSATVIEGDALGILRQLPDECVQVCVTSPPYYGLRDYGHGGQIGAEDTPQAYVERIVEVFREVRRVLKKDGTLWLNLGDSYACSPPGNKKPRREQGNGKGLLDFAREEQYIERRKKKNTLGLGYKPKDLLGIPWQVAFALRADGWYLRQDIIWHKPNPMPESVRDRCTKAHEYVFMMSKSGRYKFDSDAIKEPVAQTSLKRWGGPTEKTNVPHGTRNTGHRSLSKGESTCGLASDGMRNRRSVWTITPKPFKGAHFATFPPALVEPCILAGSSPDDIVLDPFSGAGTTGLVALQHGRQYLGIELNAEYIKLTEERFKKEGYDLV